MMIHQKKNDQSKRYYLPEPFSNIFLTLKEKTMIFHLQKGLEFSEIAKNMQLHASTILYLINNIYKKIGVSHCKELLNHPGIVLFFQRAGNI